VTKVSYNAFKERLERDKTPKSLFIEMDVLKEDQWQEQARCRFHQHFTSSFFILKCFVQHFSTYSLALKFFCQKNIGANVAGKVLVKLITSLNLNLIMFYYNRSRSMLSLPKVITLTE